MTDALLASGLENVRRLREILWDILLELQELSSSTASVMHLLAQLYSDPKCAGDKDQLTSHIPRLWPFLRHTLKPVRMAVLACIQARPSPLT